MAYDEFNNSPFDLDHDGKIDSSEASFIEDTYYEDHNGLSTGFDEDDDSDIDYGGGSSYSAQTGKSKYDFDIEKLQSDIQARKQRRILITIGIIAAVWIFVGNNIAGALILLGLYMLGSICDFWR